MVEQNVLSGNHFPEENKDKLYKGQEQFEQTKLELEQALLLDLSDEQKVDPVAASRRPHHL